MSWLIQNHGNSDKATQSFFNDRSPLLELFNPKRSAPNIDYIESTTPPRILKTHLRPHYLKKQMDEVNFKTTFVLRNPKDVLVSFYHYCQGFYGNKGSWDNFFELFIKDDLPCENIFGFISKWLELRSDPSILFIHYEEMKKDTYGCVRRLAAHLEIPVTESQVDEIVKYATVENMKKNVRPGTEFLIRKGETGGWREYFSPKQEEIINAQIADFETKHDFKFFQ